MKKKINLTINGKRYQDEVEPRLLLIHYLREVAGLTGPHIGCETSICGACTVEMDGNPVEAGTIMFVPVDGQTPTAGGEIKNGRYSVRVPIAEMKCVSRPPVWLMISGPVCSKCAFQFAELLY